MPPCGCQHERHEKLDFSAVECNVLPYVPITTALPNTIQPNDVSRYAKINCCDFL